MDRWDTFTEDELDALVSAEWQAGYDAAISELYGELGDFVEALGRLVVVCPDHLASLICKCEKCEAFKTAKADANALLVEGELAYRERRAKATALDDTQSGGTL